MSDDERPEDMECFHCALLELFALWTKRMEEKDLIEADTAIHVLMSLARVTGICHGESARYLGPSQRERLEAEALAMFHRSAAEREEESLRDEEEDGHGQSRH
jgi:hypothetical protein